MVVNFPCTLTEVVVAAEHVPVEGLVHRPFQPPHPMSQEDQPNGNRLIEDRQKDNVKLP